MCIRDSISSLGLVGSIISVGPSSSRVLLTIDINSMIPSYLTQSGWPAIAQGENGKLLKLRFLSSEANPIIGEIIETSGHGGVFPPGVNVGKIISISNGNYYVQPLPNPQKLRFVSILSSVNLKNLSLIHISEPTRPLYISYAVFCLKKKK